jgi:OFA family oxalate/formate antiporter-like MFS transporter
MQLPVLTAAAYTAFTGGMGVPGKLAFGYLADRLPVRYVAILNFSLQAVAVLVLLLTKNVPMVWIYMTVFGFSAGGYVVLQPVLVAEFFGVASVGAILGVVVAGVSIAAAIGPIVSGYVYGLLQSYHWAFVAFITAYALAVLAVFVLRVPRPVSPGAASQPS